VSFFAIRSTPSTYEMHVENRAFFDATLEKCRKM
jgi:hypothetical protein